MPVCLVIDFDGTLTTSDTTALIGQINRKTRHKWPAVVDGYMLDYATFKQQSFQWQDYGADEYSRWLDSRRWIESASFKRAHDFGLFNDVTHVDIRDAVQAAFANGSIAFRQGWTELFKSAALIQASGGRCALLSVSWSRTFVRECLIEALRGINNPDTSLRAFAENISIYANEIRSLDLTDGDAVPIDLEDRDGIRTSGDKVQQFKQIIKSTCQSGDNVTSIYIGDSATDFGCLHDADIGVWIVDLAPNELATEFVKTFDPLRAEPPVSIDHLAWTTSQIGRRPIRSRPFYWASNFSFLGEIVKQNK